MGITKAVLNLSIKVDIIKCSKDNVDVESNLFPQQSHCSVNQLNSRHSHLLGISNKPEKSLTLSSKNKESILNTVEHQGPGIYVMKKIIP